jgi:hypothetical protein
MRMTGLSDAIEEGFTLALDRIGGDDPGRYQWALRQYAAGLAR